jgi:hypothetical protein
LSVYSSSTALNAAANAQTASGTNQNNAKYISLHSASPGTSGANEISGGSYARVATTWGAASAGSAVGSQVVINVPASTTVEYWGMWTAASGGTYIDGGALPNNETYAGAGTYDLTPTYTAS